MADEAEPADATTTGEYDIFLSHAGPDKGWVQQLAAQLEKLGLRVFLDVQEIQLGDNWILKLNDGLENSRYLALVLSNHTADRPWVIQEWTSYMADKGPLKRLLPVKIDAVDLPTILKATQALDAIDRDVQRTADVLFSVVGDPSTLSSDDARRQVLGRDFVFTLSRDEDELVVVPPRGETRRTPLPWKQDNQFGIAHLEFSKLHQKPMDEGRDRTDLFRHARTLGSLLFDALFDEADVEELQRHMGAQRARPVVEIRSDDALLHSLPWELLHRDGNFLVKDGTIDLIRTTTDDMLGAALLKAPSEQFKLAVNVSAPEGSGLSYEKESYRITLATAERCEMVPTELGTLDDLVETVFGETPTGIHFSGHGLPGGLVFENDEGLEHKVPVAELLTALRDRLPDGRALPHFFYLASCHGNDPADLDDDDPGSFSAAMQLHRAGVAEVVGYFGPILDRLSTRAEETLYGAIAEGQTTRDAVRRARRRLTDPFHANGDNHRPSTRADGSQAPPPDTPTMDTHPFAWAQLVFYRRGPEWPLSVPAGAKRVSRTLRRSFEGFGDRKVLSTGFIGRRSEQHKIRKRLRAGDRVLVLQGLGGLGKSTLAQQTLPLLTEDSANVCTLWCQEVESEANRAEALVGQLLDYCRKRFGLDWEGVVQQVDQAAGDDAAQRFSYFLQALVQNAPRLVLYLDNLESLLVGPDDNNSESFGEWAEPALAAIWQNAQDMARDSDGFHLIASCRYRHGDFSGALLPVSPLPADALFRLTEWFPALQRLTAYSRARLVNRLDGHPRAVEFANDLVADALEKWRDAHGDWSLPTPPESEDLAREWSELVAPALPAVEAKLKDNLLLKAIWDRVLDDQARRFLYRMTLLRRPAEWSLLALLGEANEPEESAIATAARLRDTSLLEQLELFVRKGEDEIGTATRYILHPATVKFITETHPDAPDIRLAIHRRLGEYFEVEAKDSPYIETDNEAGHHLFEAGLYDRANTILGTVSDWLQSRGRVREGLAVLTPFLPDAVQHNLTSKLRGKLLGSVGLSHFHLSEFKKAICYYEQSLVIIREIGDRESEGKSLGNLGNAYVRLSEVEKAITYYEQQLVIAREIVDRHSEGTALGNLGVAYANLGQVEKAIAYYEQRIEIAREIGDRRGEGAVLGNLGIAYASLGEAEKAISYYEQRIEIAREFGDRLGEAGALGNLGNSYADLGQVEKAITYHEQSLIVSREIGDRNAEGRVLGNLGNTYANLGEVEKAISYYEQRIEIAREIGDRQGEGNVLTNLGSTYASLGKIEKATALLQKAKGIGKQIGDPQIIQVTTNILEKLSNQT